MSSDPIDREPEDEPGLIGAADIVAEFTALRHELKLQVRAGRDLTVGLEGLVDGCLDRGRDVVADTGQGLELVLARTRRLMEQAGLGRIDVLHEPFDPERMRAIDIAED